jgi:hypothetical protein
MHVSTPRVPLHVRPEDDVVVILVLKSVARVILSGYVALLHGHVLLPAVPIVAGAFRILVLRTLKISHESVVRVAVTTHSVDKMSPYVFFPERTAERRLAFKSRTVLATS